MEYNFYDFTYISLQEHLVEHGFSKFCAKQVFDWVYKKQELDQSKWSNVSKKLKIHLFEKCSFELPKVVWSGLSKDGTRKFLLKLDDNETIETVLIPAKESDAKYCGN